MSPSLSKGEQKSRLGATLMIVARQVLEQNRLTCGDRDQNGDSVGMLTWRRHRRTSLDD